MTFIHHGIYESFAPDLQLLSDVAYLLRTAIFRKMSAARLIAPMSLVALASAGSPAATQCECSCSCPCAPAQCPCQNQQNQTQQTRPVQTVPPQAMPQGAPPVAVAGNGAVVYNPWYPGNVVPFFSAYPFVSTPYLIFDRPIPPPIPAPPPLAAR